MEIDSGYIWTIEKLTTGIVKIHDLGLLDKNGKPHIYVLDSSKSGERPIYYLHKFFTWEALCSSTGLDDAERKGWIKIIEKVPPKPVGTTTVDTSHLEQKIDALQGLIEKMVTAQPVTPGITAEEIAKVLANAGNGNVTTRAQDDIVAMAAVKSFEKTGGNIKSSLDVSGNQSVVDSDAKKIAETLNGISFDEEEE